jgi:hypothetical protein
VATGCTVFKGRATDIPFVSSIEPDTGKYLKNVPLSDEWNEVAVIDYTPGNFNFPPAAGYKILHYVNYENDVAVDMYRELINDRNDLLDIIKYRQGSDHCDLYGEKFTAVNGIDLIEVEGDCHLWHRGDFKRKYYFVRVGPIVFTFRLFSAPENFDKNLKEFDEFMNFALNNYLIYPADETVNPYQQYAYPVSNEELISFFQPAINELRNMQ